MSKLEELFEFLRRSPDEHLKAYRDTLTKANLIILIIILIFFQLLMAIMLRSISKCFIISIVGLGLWLIFSLFLLKKPKYSLPIILLLFLASFLFMIYNRTDFFDFMSIDSILLLGYSWGMMNNTLIDCFYKWKQLTIIEGGLFIIRIASLSKLNAEIAVFHLVAVLGIWIARIYICKQRIVVEKHSLTKLQSKTTQNLNREDLLKFKNLLNHHLPSGLIILNEDMTNCLFTNHSFRSLFFELGQDNSDAVYEILRKMHVDPEEQRVKEARFVSMIPSFNLHSSQKIFSLSELISYRVKNNRLSEANSLTASCTYQFDEEEKKEGKYDVKVFPLDWDGEKAIGISFQDISYQAELFSLNLANENKEKAIGIVAHELRNPISGMLGIVKVMEKKFHDPLIKEFITTLKNNISLLLSVLNSILDIKQLNAGKLSLNIDATSISQILKNVMMLYSFQCEEKGIDFKIEIDPSVADIIYTDKERLSQILINLSGNALKFTKNGSITIRVDPYPDDPQRLIFYVKDTGIGIKAEDINKLFKVFGRIEDSSEMNKQGVGLGLVISNNLVKVLNRNEEDARITVASEHGVGTTFSFSLPKIYGRSLSGRTIIYKQDDEKNEENIKFEPIKIRPIEQPTPKKFLKDIKSNRAQETTHLTTMNNLGTGTVKSLVIELEYVLLVDDISFNLYIFKHLLEEQGIRFKQASNGQEAIEEFKNIYKEGNLVSMIFMDLEMPVMGGMEASREINKLITSMEMNSPVPIVAVSGSDGESIKRDCRDAGMKEFMVKPISEEAILQLLKKYSIVK